MLGVWYLDVQNLRRKKRLSFSIIGCSSQYSMKTSENRIGLSHVPQAIQISRPLSLSEFHILYWKNKNRCTKKSSTGCMSDLWKSPSEPNTNFWNFDCNGNRLRLKQYYLPNKFNSKDQHHQSESRIKSFWDIQSLYQDINFLDIFWKSIFPRCHNIATAFSVFWAGVYHR